jgi:hypothetical protein
MSHKFVLLNGPPRCGKDEANNAIFKHFAARHYKFSRPLKEGLKAMFQLSDSNVKWLENNKGEPSVLIDNMTWREAQIWLSEDCMKPTFGEDIFGKIAERVLREATSMQLTAISDSGFTSEAQILIDKYGAENFLLLQISREGCTFVGDSRSYIELPDVTTVQVSNHYPSIELYHTKIVRIVKQWLDQHAS